MVPMSIQIAVGETDDSNFIELMNSLVKGLLAATGYEQVWIIQIDNWFDQKWLGFSGNGLAASTIPIDRFDTVKVEFYQDKSTFPPFTPNRVLSQWSYLRTGDGYIEAPLPVLPHRTEKQSSGLNLHRRIQDFANFACFVWYSANSLANGRGSVMVYTIEADRLGYWYASFNGQREWTLEATKGLDRSSALKLLNVK
jgi:hypothetical protein